MTEMVEHWHVAGGLAGYGPDGSDGYGTATSWVQLADLLADELRNAADYLHEGAEATAGEGDKPLAWDLRKESDEVEALAWNFSNDRAQAPLYAGSPGQWDAEVRRLVEKHFPFYYDYTVGPGNAARLALYAWECEEGDECEHAADED